MYIGAPGPASKLGTTFIGLWPGDWFGSVPPIYVNPVPARTKRYYITRRGRVVR